MSFKKSCFICFNEDPLKMMKSDFYFILKALFVLTIFKFLSGIFGHEEKTAKIRLISKFMTSKPSYQTIKIHILPNTSRSNGKQTMKFD